MNLKDLYSEQFYAVFAGILQKSLHSFDSQLFKNRVFTLEFEQFELKQRMTHTAKVLHETMSTDFKTAVRNIQIIITNLRIEKIGENHLEYMFLPEYISIYGLDDFETSIFALEYITQFTSCEFAVRPFILKYGELMLAQMLIWSKHEHKSVRRLASEGSRSRLPWAMALPFIKKNPRPILPILENLNQDSCEIVRRSVANSLNDIAKDNPDVVIEIAKRWKGKSKETDGIIKHACRSLLKSANPEVLHFYGLESDQLRLSQFEIKTPIVKIGADLLFCFSLTNLTNKQMKVRLEFGIYYKKHNGSLARKVFKISESELNANETINRTKKQSFRLISTRVFYLGEHKLSLIANGDEKDKISFELID